MEDQTDSLEDWVAVRDHPFYDATPKIRLLFMVAWNEPECKIAITCRERSRKASDTESHGWSGAFTFKELKGVHEQLALVHPTLGPYLPELPVEPDGLWAYISSVKPPRESICDELRHYLSIALDVCGQKLVTKTLFEQNTFDEYFEDISELKRKVYDEDIRRARDQLDNVLFLRNEAVNMLDLSEVYSQEDEALMKLNVAWAALYNYLLQPFLDSRALAKVKVKEAKKGLDSAKTGDMGPRRRTELVNIISEWQGHHLDAADRIEQLYIDYYTETVRLQKGEQESPLS